MKLSIIKGIIISVLPKRIIHCYSVLRTKHSDRVIYNKHKKALKEIEKKSKIHCVFFALFDSVWKYDSVYNRLLTDSRFNLTILVCPIVNYGHQNMIERMEQCYRSLLDKGYNVLKSYDIKKNSYINVIEDLKPDIIFYTNPYKGLIDDRYYIDKYPNILTIYVDYGFNSILDHNMSYNLDLHNRVWRYYLETNCHQKYSINYSRIKGKNTVVTGYPDIEDLINKNYIIKSNPWHHSNSKKRIIWAPHHTIHPAGNVNFSCFIKYAVFMLQMGKKYNKDIDIAFKPHPLLKNKLIEEWGEDKTEKYYHQWEIMPNTMLQEGEYIDLFLTSDAMIHDSGSFLIEYLYTKKPVMRTMNDVDPKTMYNDFALNALDVYYKGYNEDDIEQFIKNIIAGVDPLKEKREKFFRDHLLPPNGKMPSENIVNDIIDSIDNQRV